MENNQTLDLSSVSNLALQRALRRQSYETADMIAMQINPLNHLKLKKSTEPFILHLINSNIMYHVYCWREGATRQKIEKNAGSLYKK